MDAGAANAFLQYGVVGAVAVVEAGVIVFLFKRSDAKDAIITQLQEKLLQMAVEYAKTNTELANKIIATVDTLNELFSNKQNRRK